MTRPPSLLQRELQQRRPFRTRAQEAGLAILRTADAVRHVVNAACRRFGLTLQQYNVLRILRGAGPAGLATLAIGERMVERTPGITRLIDRLEAKGLVQRQRSADDRRRVICRITPAGLRLLDKADGPVEAADESTVASLGRADQERLIALLEAVRAPLG